MAPTASSTANAGIADTRALPLQAELGSTSGLVCPWLAGGVAVGSTVCAGDSGWADDSGGVGAVNLTKSITFIGEVTASV